MTEEEEEQQQQQESRILRVGFRVCLFVGCPKNAGVLPEKLNNSKGAVADLNLKSIVSLIYQGHTVIFIKLVIQYSLRESWPICRDICFLRKGFNICGSKIGFLVMKQVCPNQAGLIYGVSGVSSRSALNAYL